MNRRYFAYGSNLDEQDWHRWCGDKGFREGLLRPLFKAWLPDRALAFTRWSSARAGGVLDVRPSRGHVVEGCVFEVAEGGWDALARKEGSPKHYCPLDTEVLTADGMAHPVRTFEVVPADRKHFVEPDESYLKVVRAGYRTFAIPETALHAAATDVPSPALLANVFVYGTLMRGESRSEVLAGIAGSAPVAGRVPGRVHDLGAFPGWRPHDANGAWVTGELHGAVDASILEALDRIEGFPGFDTPGGLFRRRIVHVDATERRQERAWIYALAGDGDHPRIESGDWRARR